MKKLKINVIGTNRKTGKLVFSDAKVMGVTEAEAYLKKLYADKMEKDFGQAKIFKRKSYYNHEHKDVAWGGTPLTRVGAALVGHAATQLKVEITHVNTF